MMESTPPKAEAKNAVTVRAEQENLASVRAEQEAIRAKIIKEVGKSICFFVISL